jgi:hypothetical protein
MYQFLIVFHIFSSCIFIGVALVLTLRSVLGMVKNWSYGKIDRVMSDIFMGLLYLTLVHGVIMYFFIDPSAKSSAMDIQQAMKQASLRFWVIEHFYVMTFALILSQIGRTFIRKATLDKSRFSFASFYYGIATFITLLSIIFYFIYK